MRCVGGGGGGGGRENGGSTADTARKRPYRKDRGPPPEQWKRCPLAIA